MIRRQDDPGEPIPVGPTARLKGVTWEQLGRMSPLKLETKVCFLICRCARESPVGRHDFSLDAYQGTAATRTLRHGLRHPEHFLPEFPPAIFLTTRPDLGDVSKGQLVTVNNFYELFNGILNPKQLDGLRLLVTQFPQQQFNATADRKTERNDGMQGVACLDCHVNGHTNGAAHLVGDIRPQENRRRIERRVCVV